MRVSELLRDIARAFEEEARGRRVMITRDVERLPAGALAIYADEASLDGVPGDVMMVTLALHVVAQVRPYDEYRVHDTIAECDAIVARTLHDMHASTEPASIALVDNTAIVERVYMLTIARSARDIEPVESVQTVEV